MTEEGPHDLRPDAHKSDHGSDQERMSKPAAGGGPSDSPSVGVSGGDEEPGAPPEQGTSWFAMSRILKLAAAGVVAAAGIMVATNLSNLGEELGDPAIRWIVEIIHGDRESLGDQLNDLVASADEDGFRLVGEPRLVAFRVAGAPARLLHLRPKSMTSNVSDEIQIYDVVMDDDHPTLRLRFRFRPNTANVNAGTRPPDGAPVDERPYAISFRLIRNVNGTPGAEVILDFVEFSVQTHWPRPAYLYWDAAKGRYRLEALLSPSSTRRETTRALLTTRYLRPIDTYARWLINQVYLRPSVIVDASGGRAPTIEPYAVEAYVIRGERFDEPRGRAEGGVILTAGYVVRGAAWGMPELLQVVSWHIDLRGDALSARASTSPPVVIGVGSNASHLEALLERAARR